MIHRACVACRDGAAVDQKIEEQTEFVRWWRETVTPSRDRRPKSENPDRRFQKEDAESLTGITQQQVSKWAKRLNKPEQYRARVGKLARISQALIISSATTSGAGHADVLNPETGDTEMLPFKFATKAALLEAMRGEIEKARAAGDTTRQDWFAVTTWDELETAQRDIAEGERRAQDLDHLITWMRRYGSGRTPISEIFERAKAAGDTRFTLDDARRLLAIDVAPRTPHNRAQ